MNCSVSADASASALISDAIKPGKPSLSASIIASPYCGTTDTVSWRRPTAASVVCDVHARRVSSRTNQCSPGMHVSMGAWRPRTNLVDSESSCLAVKRRLLPQCDFHERIELRTATSAHALSQRAMVTCECSTACERICSWGRCTWAARRGSTNDLSLNSRYREHKTHLRCCRVADRVLRVRLKQHAHCSIRESSHAHHRATDGPRQAEVCANAVRPLGRPYKRQRSQLRLPAAVFSLANRPPWKGAVGPIVCSCFATSYTRALRGSVNLATSTVDIVLVLLSTVHSTPVLFRSTRSTSS